MAGTGNTTNDFFLKKAALEILTKMKRGVNLKPNTFLNKTNATSILTDFLTSNP